MNEPKKAEQVNRSYVVRMGDDGRKEHVYGYPWNQSREKARRLSQAEKLLDKAVAWVDGAYKHLWGESGLRSEST